MKNCIWKKSVIVGIIALFIGTNIVSVTTGEKVILNNLKFWDQLDQENSDWKGAARTYLYDPMAQSFKPTLKILTRVELLLEKRGNPQGNLTISIRENLSGVDLTSCTISNEAITEEGAWTEFNFPDIGVIAEHTYFIILNHDPWIDDNFIWWGETSKFDYYPRGSLWSWENQNWILYSEEDYCFKTYGMPSAPPYKPTITGETKGTIQNSYDYTIQTTDPDLNDVKYYIDWGDGTHTITDLKESGEEIIVSHIWNTKGTYSIKVKAIDEYDAESDWTTLTVTMPCSYKPLPHFLELLFQRFPHAFPILRHFLGY